jgi:hypothetical protein
MAASKQEVLVFGEIRHAKKLLEEMKERHEFKVIFFLKKNCTYMIRIQIKIIIYIYIFLFYLKEFNSTKEDFMLEATTKYENVVAILLAHGADQVIKIKNAKILKFFRLLYITFFIH